MSMYPEGDSMLVKDTIKQELPASKMNKENEQNKATENERHQVTCNCTFCTHKQPCTCLHCINNPCNCVECMIARGPFNRKGSLKENQKLVTFEHGIQVNGHILKEIKKMIDVTRDPCPPEHVIVHNRVFDNIEMEILEVQCNGHTTYRKRKTRVINSNNALGDCTTRSMSDVEEKKFIQYWNHYWIPSVSDEDIQSNKIPNLHLNKTSSETKELLNDTQYVEENKNDVTESKVEKTTEETHKTSGSELNEAEPIPLLPQVHAYIMSYFR